MGRYLHTLHYDSMGEGWLAMPSIVGNIKIVSVGPSSVVQIGDTIVVSPVSTSKTFAGAGSFNTGDTFGPSLTNNQGNITKTNDQDLIDSSTKKVGDA